MQLRSKSTVTEMQKIMSERKINPAAGCLPVLNSDADSIWLLSCNQPNECHLMILVNSFGLNWQHQVLHLQLLAGLMQFIVLRTGPAMDNPQMKIMMYIMPFMIMIFGTFLPAALALYWVIGNIISIIQNIFIYKPFKKKEVVPVKVGGKRK